MTSLILTVVIFASNMCLYSLPSAKTNPSMPPERIYEYTEVDQKAKITYKPEPSFTRQARERCISGKVVLKVVLLASGEIGEIEVIKGMTDGLNEQTIKAAKGMKFEPAMKDGQKVSQYVKPEYNFYCRQY